MALITDPDSLNQGDITNVSDLAFTSSAGIATILTGATTLPAVATGEYFAIRDSSTVGNNGLYKATGTPTTSSISCDKVSGPDPQDLTAEDTNVYGTTGAASELSVDFNASLEEITLVEQGNLSVDGVTMLALHSFIKEEWKTDQLLIDSGAFPMVGISSAAGQWEFGIDPSGNNSDWQLHDDVGGFSIDSRRLIRNAGWVENDNAGVVQSRYFNVTTLGDFEDVADQAYYFFGNALAVDNSVDYAFAGPVNEAVLFYNFIGDLSGDTPAFATTSTITRVTGSFVTDGFVIGGQVTVAGSTSNDGTYVLTGVAALTLTVTGTPLSVEGWSTSTLAVDNDNAFTTNLRIRDGDTNGKTFGSANLASGGETIVTSKVIKVPLSNVTDLKIAKADPATGDPWDEVRLRYLDGPYNRAVDSATLRNFGIVVDVGTYSGYNGVSNGTTTFTEADFVLGVGETLADYTGGTLEIHDATAPDRAIHTIVGTPTSPGGVLTIVLSAALTNTETVLSFTMDRATPKTATKEQIYEKVQYQLRQATDIDETDSSVIGKMTGELCTFIGDDLDFALQQSINPNGGGTGVIVEGFDSNDTNSMFFWDNGNTRRNFPFVAAGNLLFNANLVTDVAGEYWLYFEYTNRTTSADIDTVGPSGDTYDLEGTLGTYLVNDYLNITGFAQSANNGLFIVTVVNVSGSDYTVRRVDGANVGTAETNQTVNVDENPIDSPDAILVDDNSASDIVGATASASIAFDFDYDNNVQGGRTAATDANCVLKAVGLIDAQYASVTGLTITRDTGLSFSITAALERNFSNP